jgi:hypothetical protein
MVERAVGEEGLARGFLEEECARAKETVDFVALLQGDEEDLAGA